MKLLNLLILALLAGCGNKADEDDNFTIEVPNNYSLDGIYLGEEYPSDTPQGLGVLLQMSDFSSYSKTVATCTWFLIDKQTAMTNSHCVPEEVLDQEGVDCSNRLMGSFKTKMGTQTRKCSKVIKASKRKTNLPTKDNDYALIKLDRPVTDSAYFELSRQGVERDEKVTIPTMQAKLQSNSILAKFKLNECEIKSSQITGLLYDPGASPLGAFAPKGMLNTCKIIKGNSGSPVLNQSGKVVGVAHGGVDENNRDQGFGKNNFSSEVGIITNLRCQELGVAALDEELKEIDCSAKPPLAEIKQTRVEKVEKYTVEVLKKAFKNLPDIFMYDGKDRRLGNTVLWTFTPTCVKPLEEWSEKSMTKIQTKGLLFKKKHITVSVPTFRIAVVPTIDYYGNMDFKFDSQSRMGASYKLEDLEKLGKKPLKATRTHLTNNFQMKFDFTIDQCQQKKQTSDV